MSEQRIEEFLKSYTDDNRFPPDFLKRFEILECLSSRSDCETLLICEHGSNKLYVAKCCATDGERMGERVFGAGLQHEGLPVFLGEWASEEMVCFVREYVKGWSLDNLPSDRSLSAEAIPVALQLCDILTYLHTQNNPVIHRDIKPQNVILMQDGRLKLIDFDISRLYNKGANQDTVYLGTRYFSSPEQYGFAQTDARADIYSLGVLLCWMLTGTMRVQEGLGEISDRGLRHIVARCVSFAPEKRYKTAKQVKKALKHVGHSKGFMTTKMFQIVGAVLLICLGFVIGKYAEHLKILHHYNCIHSKAR